MSLAHKLYKLGRLVSKDDIRDIIEVDVADSKDMGTYQTLQIDFVNGIPILNESSMDNLKTMFTKKIGGTSNSYYLYPNFELQKEGNLVKKFKAIIHTLENSILMYANEEHKKMVEPILDYIKNYNEDGLDLNRYERGNYFLILTINGKTFYELMPEVWDNYYDTFVDVHLSKKGTPVLQEEMDFITHQKVLCGYNPNVKFFTYDNYHDKLKPDIINKLPMSKESAIAIKKGWMYAITYLKFSHKGLEYIIIPSMVNFDENRYKELLKKLKNSTDIQTLASKEDSFIRKLSKQIEEFDSSGIALDILFTKVDTTNLSVKIFATLEDVLPSRINFVVRKMKEFKISDSSDYKDSKNTIYLKDFFLYTEKTAKTKKLKGLENRIKQDKIALSKILLGYEKTGYKNVLLLFEKHREILYNYKENKIGRRLIDSKNKDSKVKEWIEYPDSFVQKEDKILEFLQAINAIKE